ncbi:MAG: Fe-S cluster assembly protein SufD, partial [Planctomycetes bacterium]|nr:Fe-S cluster assembly protein SufD [Planctomycetota bacterium]
MNETLVAPPASDGAFLLRASQSLQGALARQKSDPAWLRARRAQAVAQVQALGLPGPRAEAWRFTSLRALDKLAPLARTGSAPALPAFAPDALILVLRNGRFDAQASQLRALPPGVALAPLERALAEERPAARFGELARAEGHFFNALNEALFDGGVLLRLESGAVLDRPLQIVHLVDPSAETLPSAHARVHVILERGASAHVLERYLGAEGSSFSNPVTELVLQEG